MLEPGTYYIGDLCYVFNHEKWDKICDCLFSQKEGTILFELDGMKFYNMSTAYGDGTYMDNKGRSYPVDSATIGCVNVSHIDEDKKPKDEKDPCGHLITFTEPFECSVEDGCMSFGRHVVINTRGEESENEESENDDDEDDEEHSTAAEAGWYDL